MSGAPTFQGYRREDGAAGCRNHVLVVSAMDVVNPLVRRIAAAVHGTVAITSALGRAHAGAETEQRDRLFAGLVANPNVAGALVVGFEPEATARLAAEAAAASGRPVHHLAVLADGSTTDLLREGVRTAASLVAAAGRTARSEVPLAELVLGLKCGGSDPTSGLVANAVAGRVSDRVVAAGGTVILTETEDMVGAEEILARRAVSPAVGERLVAAVRHLEEQAIAAGARLSNLHKDHLAAGLTTNEEKALGSVQKAGSAPLQAVIGYGERPPGKGLVFMDAIGGGVPELTGLAAAGAQVLLFVTGTGHPTGNPVAPTIKVTGNPRTANRFAPSIDLDLGAVLTGEATLDEAADWLWAELLAVLAGRRTGNETLGDVETAITPATAYRNLLVGPA